jgi:hypothetical protein
LPNSESNDIFKEMPIQQLSHGSGLFPRDTTLSALIVRLTAKRQVAEIQRDLINQVTHQLYYRIEKK